MNTPTTPIQPGFVPPNHIYKSVESTISKYSAKLADLKKSTVELPSIETVDINASLKGLEALQQVTASTASTNTASTAKLFGIGMFSKMAKNGNASALEAALNNHKPNEQN
jgi:hypothetical protein